MKTADGLDGQHHRSRIKRKAASIVACLLAVAAIVVLLVTCLLPTLQIFGTSMEPTLNEGEIVVCAKLGEFHAGDLIAFDHNNKILVKRVICGPGDWFDMREDGTVLVNDVELEEPYVSKKSFGSCDIALPYQVPEGRYFVMGDQRDQSMDSRMVQVGCVTADCVVGKPVLRVWPPNAAGIVS